MNLLKISDSSYSKIILHVSIIYACKNISIFFGLIDHQFFPGNFRFDRFSYGIDNRSNSIIVFKFLTS